MKSLSIWRREKREIEWSKEFSCWWFTIFFPSYFSSSSFMLQNDVFLFLHNLTLFIVNDPENIIQVMCGIQCFPWKILYKNRKSVPFISLQLPYNLHIYNKFSKIFFLLFENINMNQKNHTHFSFSKETKNWNENIFLLILNLLHEKRFEKRFLFSSSKNLLNSKTMRK